MTPRGISRHPKSPHDTHMSHLLTPRTHAQLAGDPETTHAPFVIYVVPAGSAFEGSDFVRQGRMFTATQKRTVIAVVNKGGAGVNYFELATG